MDGMGEEIVSGNRHLFQRESRMVLLGQTQICQLALSNVSGIRKGPTPSP